MWSRLSLALLWAVVTLPSFIHAAAVGSLQKITADFYNPTNVTFYLYVPPKLSASPPVLVSPHWCHGDALAVYKGSSFASLADKHGFLVIYPDSPNAEDKCWDVSSRGTLSHQSGPPGGDSLGIVNMVQWTIKQYGADAGRVFVTGVSSGAMMTNVLLGAYPDVFAAGTAFAGVPFGCFSSGENNTFDYWNAECATGQVRRSGAEWKAIVEAAYPGYEGWRPKVQVFHGTADDVLFYANFEQEILQWTSVFGLDGGKPVSTVANTPFANWTRYAFGRDESEIWFEAYSAANVTHNIGNHEEIALQWFDLACTADGGKGCFRWGRRGPLGHSLRNATTVVVS
ncbi:acetylxylan esterase-like protein 1 precursor [Apodospora peruviana]|uniref:Carboxylic ester hydrolase n=1 Tax=Apodospora peruviana TaxID=516989 RepID=A0AAE0HVG2_9PEZI|nr:acetylxylan esterase-like protein 1 precursor [Apodospora peruviana]